MLRPVDIAVAFDVALTGQDAGRWQPADVRRNLGLPRATLSDSLDRLDEARVVRGQFVNRSAIASLLPVLPHLAPLRRAGEQAVDGLCTGWAAPAFGGQFRGAVELVWEAAGGPHRGVPIRPLHPRIPAQLLSSGDERRYAMLAWLDAVRGGRAREVAHGVEGLRLLCGLPPSPGVRRQAGVDALMGGIVEGLWAARNSTSPGDAALSGGSGDGRQR